MRPAGWPPTETSKNTCGVCAEVHCLRVVKGRCCEGGKVLWVDRGDRSVAPTFCVTDASAAGIGAAAAAVLQGTKHPLVWCACGGEQAGHWHREGNRTHPGLTSDAAAAEAATADSRVRFDTAAAEE